MQDMNDYKTTALQMEKIRHFYIYVFIYHCKEILRVDTYDIWRRMFHQIFYIIYLASTVTEKSLKDTDVKTDSTVMQP